MINNTDHKDRQIAYLGQSLQYYQQKCAELELQLVQANATIERLISESDEGVEI